MARPRHPDKHIEESIRYGESLGWRVAISSGHAWGHLRCPHSARGGCIIAIWSTPKNPQNHAHKIMRDIGICPHKQE